MSNEKRFVQMFKQTFCIGNVFTSYMYKLALHINKRTRHISSHEVDIFIPHTYRLRCQLLCSCQQVSSGLHQDEMYNFTLLKNN